MKNIYFKILDKKPQKEDGYLFYLVEINIQEKSRLFQEDFRLIINRWSLEDYKKQWQEGFERLKQHNKSCLVTSIGDPKIDLLSMWCLYKKENKIYIQEHRYMENKKMKSFFDYIPDYSNDEYSEWIVDFE